jgi:hypothetical protein
VAHPSQPERRFPQKSQPGETTLSRQLELEQYPMNPKNPLHPDETSVSVARRAERQEERGVRAKKTAPCGAVRLVIVRRAESCYS